MNNILIKWSPIIQLINIDKKYYQMVAEYCEDFTKNGYEGTENLLPVQLKILSKLDLSKVILNSDIEPCVFETHEISVIVDPQDMFDITNKTGIDVIIRIESAMIEEQSMYLNKVINEKGGVVLNRVCGELESDLVNQKMKMKSSFISFSDYRQLKLKKISERN